jgi:hypothetical protein
MEHHVPVLPVEPHHIRLVPAQPTEMEQVPPPGHEQPAPTADQVRAVDQVFTSRRGPELLVGLLGLQFGAMMLRDLAVETFEEPDEEEEEPRRRPAPEDGC